MESRDRLSYNIKCDLNEVKTIASKTDILFFDESSFESSCVYSSFSRKTSSLYN